MQNTQKKVLMPNAKVTSDTHVSERTFSALGTFPYRFIWIGGVFSNLGSFIQITAAAWLMTTLTDSTTLVALVQSAAAVPAMVLALIAGATADIFNKRTQMVASISFSAFSMLSLVLLYEAGLLTPWLLLLFTALAGTGLAFYLPAWQSSLPDMVSRTHFFSAVSLNNFSLNVARCVGPAIAAEVLVRSGAGIAFSFNFLSFVILGVAIFFWKQAPMPERVIPRETVLRAIGDGLRYALLSPAMTSIVVRGFCFPFCASAVMALPPIIAIYLGGDARFLGVLLVGFGAGAMVGALSLAWTRTLTTFDNLALWSTVVMAGALAILALSTSLIVSTCALFICGFAWVQVMSSLQVAIQMSCPRWVAGRMVSMLTTTFSAGIALGSAVWGAISGTWGVSFALGIASGITLLVGFALRFIPSDQPTMNSLEPHRNLSDDSLPKIDLNAGPVVIQVDYSVPVENVPDFVAMMSELRRVRVRDGVRSWTLAQDISERSLWIERFQSPTWADYLRFRSRRVKGDADIADEIKDLCEKEPVWRRQLERTARAKPLKAGDIVS